FLVKYTGEIPEQGVAPWMTDSYDVGSCDPHNVVNNMLSNPDYTMEIDVETNISVGLQKSKFPLSKSLSNIAQLISEDSDTHGSTFMPIGCNSALGCASLYTVILGSDKTTVLVATGQNDYYPLYASIENIQNTVCCAHHNAVAMVGFLAMPKSMYSHVHILLSLPSCKAMRQHAETPDFQSF
ncbi:hypothetical protein BDR06DRAFT_880806, partial [Suillus hirtellus]